MLGRVASHTRWSLPITTGTVGSRKARGRVRTCRCWANCLPRSPRRSQLQPLLLASRAALSLRPVTARLHSSSLHCDSPRWMARAHDGR
ncbi:hypothetical protein BU26DRAFT_8261 [Trematosphaeria pertusa]|uniref:Uncharacterized protein n=1 Tax=Trematosphaeria pertusa TaxID=390896 RepID=A0A6A6IZ10_9PLEO|nr:uncharacterized protein BU26DRAFT_8261 [Trematosphaeria pertusa]KAF2255785.1 hypothetical protein BU26DRAFT_8261 [Trematosphaeria pertusa]